ncbi:MAG: hypothetical protein M1812_004323 [Candelaria pacifica]|nr:MAG: hypothetical protein M1812_004323 [Candelaria pacifica]
MAVPWQSIFGSIAKGVAQAIKVVKRSVNVAEPLSASPVDQSRHSNITDSILEQAIHAFADQKRAQGEVKERRLEIVRRVPTYAVRGLAIHSCFEPRDSTAV